MILSVVGINHRTTSLSEREPFQIARRDLGKAVLKYKRITDVDEVVIVATCNRIEFYRANHSRDKHLGEVEEFYRLRGVENPQLIRDFSYIHSGAAAARHLFRVISGMDSLVLGEDQIRTQVKDSYSSSCAYGGPGKALHKLFHHAFRVSKKIKNQTDLGSGIRSVPGAGLELLHEANPQASSALVIGANETTEVILAGLRRKNIEAVVVNRTEYAAFKTAEKYGARAKTWEEIPAVLNEVDLVFSATGATGFVITPEMINDSNTRKHLYIADLAIPRDVDPGIRKYHNITLFDLEDLKYHLDKISERRCTYLPDAQELVEIQVSKYLNWMHDQQYAGGINELKKQLHDAADEELQRFLPGFHQSEKKGLDAFAHAMIKRFLKIARQQFDPNGIISETKTLRLDPTLIEEPLPIENLKEVTPEPLKVPSKKSKNHSSLNTKEKN